MIIHSGNAYGGHYHTYIRDFDHLGKWTREPRSFYADDKYSRTKIGPQNNPALFEDLNESKMPVQESAKSAVSNREIQLICLDESDPDFDEQSQLVNLDYRSYSSPIELLKAYVYNKYKYDYAEIGKTHMELKQVVHDLSFDHLFVAPGYERLLDSFELSPDRNTFRLRECDRVNIGSKKNLNDASTLLSQAADDELPSYFDIVQESQRPRDDLNQIDSQEAEPEPNPWFDFDDSRVSSITSREIVNQFEGRESAYMLFYRRKNTSTNSLTNTTTDQDQSHLIAHHEKVPDWIRQEIESENKSLALKRETYEDQVNKFNIDCHMESDFYLDQDVLNMQQYENRPFTLAVDKRTTTIGQLRECLVNSCTEYLTKKSNTPGEVVERREELFLNTLLDQSITLHWLLCCRVEGSGDDGTAGYFIKTVLDNENENVHQAMTSNAYKNSKSILMISKDKSKWPVGESYLPIRLVVKYFNNETQLRETSFTFTRATLISKLKETISEFILSENQKLFGVQALVDGQQLSALDMRFSYTQRAYLVQNEKVLLTETFMDKTLDEVWLRNGDFIIVETFMNIDESLLQKNAINQHLNPGSKAANVKTYKIKMVGCLSSPLRCVEDSFDSNAQISQIKNMAALKFIEFATHDNVQYHMRYVNSEVLGENKWLLALVNQNSSDDNSNDPDQPVKGDVSLTDNIGVAVHDDINLSYLMETLGTSVGTYPARNRTEAAENVDSIVLLFCHGKAPLSSLQEIVVRCSLETTDCALDLTNSQIMTEVIVDLDNCTIEDLTRQVVNRMQLEPLDPNGSLQYILKTTNWLGDSENVLNSVSLSCREAKLKHNQLLLIGKGKLIPPNHIKIRLWQQRQDRPSPTLEADVASMTVKEEPGEDLVVLNGFIEDKYKQFRMLEELIIKYDTKLADLKETVLGIINKQQTDSSPPVENIRLRTLRKVFATTSTDQMTSPGSRFITKRALIDWHKSLRQLHLLPETDLCAQLITEEEESQINQGIVILCCVQINLKTRKVHKNTFKEIYWNVNNGATLSTLKDSILKSYPDLLKSSNLFEMHVAKRQIEKFQWILLKEQAANSSEVDNVAKSSAASKIKRQKSQNQQTKINLRNAPYNMDDGDLIAFTLEKLDDGQKMDAQLFMSEEDLSFYSKKEMSIAELARVSREKKKSSQSSAPSQSQRSVRPEIGIKIEIDDY